MGCHHLALSATNPCGASLWGWHPGCLGSPLTLYHRVNWSTLFQVMAWCCPAPSHYLNQCWVIINEFSKTYSWMEQLGPKSLPQGPLLSPIMGVTPTLSGKIPNGKQCTPRLLNSPNLMAVGLSVGVWDIGLSTHPGTGVDGASGRGWKLADFLLKHV